MASTSMIPEIALILLLSLFFSCCYLLVSNLLLRLLLEFTCGGDGIWDLCRFASLFLFVPDNKAPRIENCQFTLYPYIESVDFGRIALTCDDSIVFAVLPPLCNRITIINQCFFRGWPCLFLPIILPQ